MMKPFRRRHKDIPALSWLETTQGLPRATLDGRNRALIENHTGIIEFSTEKIRLASKLGEITVSGSELSLAQVRRDQLIAIGRIDSVTMPDGGQYNG